MTNPKLKYFFGALIVIASCRNAPEKTDNETVPEKAVEATVASDTFTISSVIPEVTCRHQPGYSYALYLPSAYSSDTLPVLILIDPHGDGVLPVSRYTTLAEAFGVILMGSNNSKNGITFIESTPIIKALVDEAVSRFHVEIKDISIGGFSGGAKAGLVAASEIPGLNAVIYCGAGFPSIPQPLPPALGIAGLKDMNYTEVVQTDAQMDASQISHALIEWNGKHEWSDVPTFRNAFFWILFRALEKGHLPVDDKLVTSFIRENSKSFSDPLQEELRLKKMIAFLQGVEPTDNLKLELVALMEKPAYARAEAKHKADIELEARMKQNYLQCITQKDLLWWREETNRLKSMKSDPANDRILAYISLACYTYTNNALQQEDLANAEKYLAIYAFVDWENMDRVFMQARLNGMRNNKTGVMESLREAIRYGFKDKTRLMTEPSFASVRNSEEFQSLIAQMK